MMRLWTLACAISGLIVGGWLSQYFGVIFGLLGFGAFALLGILGLIAFSIKPKPRVSTIIPTHPPTTKAGLNGCLQVVGAIVLFTFLGLFLFQAYFSSLTMTARLTPSAHTQAFVASSPIPRVTPTIQLTILMVSTQTTDQPTSDTKAAQPDCVSVSVISLADVGQTLCVYGEVKSVGADQAAQYINFQDSGLRLITYDLSLEIPHQPGNCLKVKGLIRQLGSRPVMLFQVGDLYKNC